MNASTTVSARIAALDLARSAALLGMAVYHFSYDLQMFGYLAPGTVTSGGWGVFARLVAGSFIAIAGISLVLAHRGGLRPGAYLRRLAVIGAAAALVSLATFFAFPGNFIFFGILHSIFVSSVIGVLFLHAPWLLTAGAGVAVLVLPRFLQIPALDDGPFQWLGLSGHRPSLDFEPVFPWAGPFLLGMAAAQLAGLRGWLDRPRRAPGTVVRRLAWPGRHSLAVYLLHQPVLVSVVALARWLGG